MTSCVIKTRQPILQLKGIIFYIFVNNRLQLSCRLYYHKRKSKSLALLYRIEFHILFATLVVASRSQLSLTLSLFCCHPKSSGPGHLSYLLLQSSTPIFHSNLHLNCQLNYRILKLFWESSSNCFHCRPTHSHWIHSRHRPRSCLIQRILLDYLCGLCHLTDDVCLILPPPLSPSSLRTARTVSFATPERTVAPHVTPAFLITFLLIAAITLNSVITDSMFHTPNVILYRGVTSTQCFSLSINQIRISTRRVLLIGNVLLIGKVLLIGQRWLDTTHFPCCHS